MTPESNSFGARAARFFKRLVITVLVLGLAGASAYLASMLNNRTFSLEIHDGKLVVMKGLMMPTGSEPWKPGDAVLADAYAPLELEGTSPMGVVGMKFTERDELDRALWSVIEGLARFRVNSDDPGQLDRGLYYLRRGDRLTGLTNEQKLSLTQLKADVAYYTARARLEDAQKQIEEALVQLKLASQAQNRHARSASQMLTEVEPSAKALSESLRKAVHTLSAPAEQPKPPEPPKPAEPAAAPKPEPVKEEGEAVKKEGEP